MPQPILVGYDPARRDIAPVHFGIAAAGLTGAPLIVASVQTGPAASVPGYRSSAEDLQGDRVALDELRPVLSVPGLNAERRTLIGDSAPSALHRAAEELQAGLLVVGSTDRGRGGVLGPGSTAERLMHGAPCAIAVVPHEWLRGGGLATLGVAYIDTPEARDAVRGAVALARRSGAKLRVLGAVKPHHFGRPAGGPPGSGFEASTYDQTGTDTQQATSAAQALIGETGDLKIDIDISAQEPADFLIAASDSLDLLICGSRGYGPRKAVLLGGVTREVVRGARCPVILLARGTEAQLEALIGGESPDRGDVALPKRA